MPYSAGSWDSSQSLRRSLAAALAAALMLSLLIADPPSISIGGSEATPEQAYVRLPLSFETNLGQAPAGIDFMARGEDLSLLLGPRRATMAFGDSNAVTMRLVGADPNSTPYGGGEGSGVVNYFVGNDPQKWISGAPTHSSVGYKEVYRGIDVVYYGNDQQLEFDFLVAPGSHPEAVEIRFTGSEAVRLEDGDLVVDSSSGSLRWQEPIAYQEIDGSRRPVDAGFVLTGDRSVAFQVGRYDATHQLVIDPVLEYSTYLGGSLQEIGAAVGVDAAGNIYVTGETSSLDLPTQNPVQGNYAGNVDAFVAKLDPATNVLVYSTYLGGSLDEDPRSLAVSPSGNAFAVGATSSADYPTTSGAYQPTFAGGKDAYVTRLGPTGAMDASTFLGGTSQDARTNVALDANGVVHVAGYSKSNNFPVTPDAIQQTKAGNNDTYLSRLTSDLSTLLYSTYIGGSNHDTGRSVAADEDGNSYVVGWTMSTDFPVINAFQPQNGGGADAFISKVAADGSHYVYSSYIGGSGDDWGPYSGGQGVAFDSDHNAYVVGYTASTDFPVVNALQPTYGGGVEDGFAVRVRSDGSALDWATYLGGTGLDEALGVGADPAGAAYVVGLSQSQNFPTVDPLQNPGGGMDAFVTKIEPSGASGFSSFLGGKGTDKGRGVVVTPDAVYVTGQAASSNFPTVNPLQPANAGKADAFVLKIGDGDGEPPPPPPPPPQPPPPDDTTPPTVTLLQPGADAILKDGGIKAKWEGTDNVGVDHYDLYERQGISGAAVLVQSSPARTFQTTGSAGTYCYQVEAFDAAENSDTSEERCVAVPHDDRSASIVYAGNTAEITSTGAYFDTLTVLDGAGQSAEFVFSGRKFSILAQKNPASGKAGVYVDGVLDQTVDLYGSSVKNQAYVYTATVAEGTHTVEIRWTGTKRPQSSGTALSLDGIAAISD